MNLPEILESWMAEQMRKLVETQFAAFDERINALVARAERTENRLTEFQKTGDLSFLAERIMRCEEGVDGVARRNQGNTEELIRRVRDLEEQRKSVENVVDVIKEQFADDDYRNAIVEVITSAIRDDDDLREEVKGLVNDYFDDAIKDEVKDLVDKRIDTELNDLRVEIKRG